MLPAAAISAASARSSSVPGRSAAAMALSLGARAPRSRLAFLKPKVLKCQAFKRQVVKRQVFTHQVLDPQAAPIRAAVTSELWHAMVTIACHDAYPAWRAHPQPSGSR